MRTCSLVLCLLGGCSAAGASTDAYWAKQHGVVEEVYLPPAVDGADAPWRCQVVWDAPASSAAPWGTDMGEWRLQLPHSYIWQEPEERACTYPPPERRRWHAFQEAFKRQDELPKVVHIRLQAPSSTISSALAVLRFTGGIYGHREVGERGILTLHDFRTANPEAELAQALLRCVIGTVFLHRKLVDLPARVSQLQLYLGHASPAAQDFWRQAAERFPELRSRWNAASQQHSPPSGFRDLRRGLNATYTAYGTGRLPALPSGDQGDSLIFGDHCTLLDMLTLPQRYAGSLSASADPLGPHTFLRAYPQSDVDGHSLPGKVLLQRNRRTIELGELHTMLERHHAQGWPAPFYSLGDLEAAKPSTCADLSATRIVMEKSSRKPGFFDQLHQFTQAVLRKPEALKRYRINPQDHKTVQHLRNTWAELREQVWRLQQRAQSMSQDALERSEFVLHWTLRLQEQHAFDRVLHLVDVSQARRLRIDGEHQSAPYYRAAALRAARSTLFLTAQELLCQMRGCLGDGPKVLGETDCPETVFDHGHLCNNEGNDSTPLYPLLPSPERAPLLTR